MLMVAAIGGHFVGVPLIRPRIRMHVQFHCRRVVLRKGTLLRLVCSGAAFSLLGGMSLVEVLPLLPVATTPRAIATEPSDVSGCNECRINAGSGPNLSSLSPIGAGNVKIRATLFQPPFPISTMGYFPAPNLWETLLSNELAERNGRAVIILHDRN